MIPRFSIVALALAFASGLAAQAAPSPAPPPPTPATTPATTPTTASATAPATAPAAQLSPAERGVAEAKADIAAGRLHIHYFGKPWSAHKPLVDDASGLPVEVVAGCLVSDEFSATTHAFNTAMREAAATRAAPKR